MAKNMEYVFILVILWFVCSIFLAIIWYCYYLNTLLTTEREANRLQIHSILVNGEKERKDLYDRLMAGTLTQYVEQAVTAPNEIEQVEDEVVSLEDAKEELMENNG